MRFAADLFEETARIAADSTLTANLAAEASMRFAADLFEETARIAADSTLTANLAAEASMRAAADTALSSNGTMRVFSGSFTATDALKLLSFEVGAGKTLLNGFNLEHVIDPIVVNSKVPVSFELYVNGLLLAPMYDGANFKVFGTADVDAGDATKIDGTKFLTGDYAFYRNVTGPQFRIAFKFALLSTDVVTIKYNKLHY